MESKEASKLVNYMIDSMHFPNIKYFSEGPNWELETTHQLKKENINIKNY